ncbi:MAG: F0F1 ATP synthase subunit epsilon [Bacillota bacterium]|nr:F0F1 ATP synthase subunit epsilon [Bacillota bacterium]
MNNHFKLHILTPHCDFFNDTVLHLKIMDSKGPMEILPNHMYLVTMIKPSSAEFTDSNGKIYTALISEGIMKVHDNTVVLLCKNAAWPENTDDVIP